MFNIYCKLEDDGVAVSVEESPSSPAQTANIIKAAFITLLAYADKTLSVIDGDVPSKRLLMDALEDYVSKESWHVDSVDLNLRNADFFDNE